MQPRLSRTDGTDYDVADLVAAPWGRFQKALREFDHAMHSDSYRAEIELARTSGFRLGDALDDLQRALALANPAPED